MRSMRSVKSYRSRDARSARSGGSRSSLDSMVSAAPSAAPSQMTAKRSVRGSRSSMRRQGTEQEMKKQLQLKKRYEAELDAKTVLYQQLLSRLRQQEEAIAAAQEGLRVSKQNHEQRMTEAKEKMLQLRADTVDCQDRIADKEAIVAENRDEISRWERVLEDDEVRRAFNFILKKPNPDIDGVSPEEVLTPSMMGLFYACKRRTKSNRRFLVAVRKATNAAAVAAGLVVPMVACLLANLREEARFKRAVMRSVGVKEHEVGRSWLFRTVVEQAKQVETPAPPASSKPGPIPEPPHWAKYRLNLTPAPPPPKKTPVQELIASCRSELDSLEYPDKTLGSSRAKAKAFRRRLDKHFEQSRAKQETPDPPQLMHVHLPDPYAATPVAHWLG